MADDFTPFISKIKSAPLVPAGADIKPFEMPKLVEGDTKTYTQIRSAFKKDLSAKDARFFLSELVANQMSVEQEEQRRFDKKVAETVEATLKGIREEAHKNGFAEGREAGTKQGYEEEKARLAQHLEGIAFASRALAEAKNQLDKQYEVALVEMGFKLAKIVVHHEIQEKPEIIAKTIADILGRIAKDDDVMVRLSPQEFEAIEQISDEIKAISRQGRVSFEADQGIPRGACVVESLSGEIASNIEDKFRKLQEELSKKLNQSHRKVAGTGQ
jgi:flagellar assembly protein FliH